MGNETFHYWDGLTGGYERSKTVVPKTDSRRFTEPGGREGKGANDSEGSTFSQR